MRTLLLTILIACKAPASSAPDQPSPPASGAEQWTETTQHRVGGCDVGISNIWVRDGLGLSATFSIHEPDGNEHQEFVTPGSTVVVCGVSLDVVRIDVPPHTPGSVFVHQ
jgi:hypothetical protein